MTAPSASYDLVVIGAGSAGYWAAKTAGKAGASVALVDPGPLGGLCILRGCMPTKTLLRSTEVLHLARRADRVGVTIPEVGYDFGKIMARKRHWVDDFATYRREGILKQDGFTFHQGAARFVDPHTVELHGSGRGTLTAERFIVATGSVPQVPEIAGLAETGYWTSDEALEIASPPKSIAVVGGGVIALELGQFFARLGAETTILMRGPRVLTNEDDDVAAAIQEELAAEGIRFVSKATLLGAEPVAGGLKRLRYRRDHHDEALEVEAILVAAGRRPNVAHLGLALAGVETQAFRVPTDGFHRTNQKHIYAVGDVHGQHQIVHVAIEDGIRAARHATGQQPDPASDRLLAWAIYTDPNVAKVGLSEADCAKRGIPCAVGSYPFDDQGKALVSDLTAGFVKVIAHRDTGEILGAAVVGAEGADLVHELIVAISFRATCRQFLAIPHLHPTLAEIWIDAVEACEDARQEALATAGAPA